MVVQKNMTASLEDYLEAIYFLNGEKGEVRVTDLAAQMGISKPSVNRAINTLKCQGYVLHEHYKSLSLTKEGLALAKDVAKRHEILKRFLVQVLSVEETTAEQEACSIEHILSMDTIKKIEALMEKTPIE